MFVNLAHLKAVFSKNYNFVKQLPRRTIVSALGLVFISATLAVVVVTPAIGSLFVGAQSTGLASILFNTGRNAVSCKDGGKITFTRTDVDGTSTDAYHGFILCAKSTTATPTPSATPQPTATPQSTPNPSNGVTYCPDNSAATHDYNTWHDVYDESRNCYYDHEHGDNPSELDAVFGPIGAAFGMGDKTIHIPWHTSANENKMEVYTTTNGVTYDLGKHGGMKVSTYANIVNPCQQDAYSWVKTAYPFNKYPLSCVTDIRILHHWKGDADFASRFHSVWREMKVCAPTADGKPDKSKCGIIKSGGWADYGVFHCPYKSGKCFLPGIDPTELATDYNINLDPYRAIDNNSLGNVFLANTDVAKYAKQKTSEGGGNDNKGVITTCNPFSALSWCKNSVTSHKFFVYDIPFALNKDKLLAPLNGSDMNARYRESISLICPDGKCRFNNTEFSLFEATANIPENLDPKDGATDGFVTWSGWTDRYGTIVTNCTSPGLDCVPLVYQHAPVGYAAWSSQPGLSGSLLPRKNHDVMQPDLWPINPAKN